jgi:hypothetical protein
MTGCHVAHRLELIRSGRWKAMFGSALWRN